MGASPMYLNRDKFYSVFRAMDTTILIKSNSEEGALKLYMIEAAGGPTPFYTWMTALEIINEIKSVNKKGKYKASQEKYWQRDMKKFLKGWSILDEDTVNGGDLHGQTE